MTAESKPMRAPAERWQHGVEYQTEEGRQRVPNNVENLHKSGKIGAAEVLAADRWYRDYALGICGVFDAEPGRSSGGGDAHTAGFARAKAATAYRSARAAVGGHGELVLRLFVADGMTFNALGEAIGMHHSEAKGAVFATLRRLSEHYSEEAKPGPASTNIRFADFSS